MWVPGCPYLGHKERAPAKKVAGYHSQGQFNCFDLGPAHASPGISTATFAPRTGQGWWFEQSIVRTAVAMVMVLMMCGIGEGLTLPNTPPDLEANPAVNDNENDQRSNVDSNCEPGDIGLEAPGKHKAGPAIVEVLKLDIGEYGKLGSGKDE